jgi:hypothetical protein
MRAEQSRLLERDYGVLGTHYARGAETPAAAR